MKKTLLFFLIPVFHLFNCQLQFGPSTNHNYQSYSATIQGSGTIYYTTDGSDPTINSSSAVNLVEITITKNIILKARLKGNNDQLSELFSRPYYIGELPQKTVYFKPPPGWTSNCSYMNFIQPEFLVDFSGPGDPMTPACEGWYKSTFSFYKALVTFNNCKAYAPPPIYEYFSTSVEDIVFYDYSLGPITNPPLCLLAIADPAKKVVIVKVFPNPVQDFITVESDIKFVNYELLDASGKSLRNSSFLKKVIDVSSLSKGIYFIKLKSVGQENTVLKFIKK